MNFTVFVALMGVLLVLGCTQAGTSTQAGSGRPSAVAGGEPVKPLSVEAPAPATEALSTPAPVTPVAPAVGPVAEATPPVDGLVVEKGDTIRVFYKGTFDDGTVFDSTEKNGNRPMEFVAGMGLMIPGFDAAVLGMKVGEEKSIHLSAEESYGLPDPKRVKEVSLAELKQQGIEPKVGDTLYAEGVPFPLSVVGVTATHASVAFNHPLVGKALNFWIKIENISKPEKAAEGSTQ